MSAAFDAVLVAALAREVEGRLQGARLRALRLDRGSRSLALLFREGTLRFDLDVATASVGWHEPAEPGPLDHPLPARLERSEVPPDDRVLRLTFRRLRGAPATVDVIVQWITNRWTALVTEGPELVIRQVLVQLDGDRAPRTGQRWSPPPLAGREGADGTLTAERWRELLLAEGPGARRHALLSRVAWSSALNAAALLGWAADSGGPAAADALERGHQLWRQLAAVALGRLRSEPVLLHMPHGLQPYPLPLPNVEGEPVPTLLDGCAGAAPAALSTGRLPTDLIEALRARAVRARARVQSLARELAETPDPAALRGSGDLLLARLGEIQHGSAAVRLVDFTGYDVELELDPAASAADNAAAYYDRAARAERARTRLPELVREAEANASRLDALVERAEMGDLSEERLRAELPLEGRTAPGSAPASLPYRAYRSSGGLEIRVGRGSRHNDDLTFHHASPGDAWLHARHAAGAHVVLRWQGKGGPPSRDLMEAAVLAALHSKAHTSGAVPVDWTRRKYVRKPRKAPPGQVLVERVKTLFVEPDPALEERLREE